MSEGVRSMSERERGSVRGLTFEPFLLFQKAQAAAFNMSVPSTDHTACGPGCVWTWMPSSDPRGAQLEAGDQHGWELQPARCGEGRGLAPSLL